MSFAITYILSDSLGQDNLTAIAGLFSELWTLFWGRPEPPSSQQTLQLLSQTQGEIGPDRMSENDDSANSGQSGAEDGSDSEPGSGTRPVKFYQAQDSVDDSENYNGSNLESDREQCEYEDEERDQFESRGSFEIKEGIFGNGVKLEL